MNHIVSETLSIVNGVTLSHPISGRPSNTYMRVVEEVRRLRLQQLKEEFGGYSRINKLLGRLATDSTLSQIANQAKDSKTGKPRVMGSPQARAIEAVCSKEEGWMDTDPALTDDGVVAGMLTKVLAMPPETRERVLRIIAGLVDEFGQGHSNQGTSSLIQKDDDRQKSTN